MRMGVSCLSGQIKSARLTLLRRKITFVRLLQLRLLIVVIFNR